MTIRDTWLDLAAPDTVNTMPCCDACRGLQTMGTHTATRFAGTYESAREVFT